MDPAELNIDVELEELETRLERLRALYEQYFLGIEKIEPSVARKDVDRRIWVLRREKIRNTGRRFKFQTIIQRYNTFQQYWQRICREIDSGTYKRHMLRAEKLLGTQALTIAAKRRQGAYVRRPEDEAAKAAEQEAAKKQAEEERARAEAEEAQRSRERDLDSLLGVRGVRADTPRAEPKPAPKPDAPAGKPARPKLVLERLELDIDDLLSGGKKPISSRPPPRPTTQERPIAQARPTTQERPIAEAAPASIKPSPVIAVASAARERPAPPPPPKRQPPPLPRRAAPPTVAPAPAPRAAPPPAPTRAAPPAPARGPDVAKSPSAGVTEQRMRELHTRLSDAKKQLNDPRSVSLDGLTKQLRQAEDSLRKQHGNRKIDFDVVIKDGKAVVKPILK